MLSSIKILNARENNLKEISLEIPRNKFVVLTGVSGSGKSSLAFDTIYAEGQRRYVESLSTHARQFLNQMKKPDVDSIEGLSPSISIQQRVAFGSPRSTVGTTTEIYDYLRVLYARIGKAFCSNCGKPIHSQTPQEIVDQIIKHENQQLIILSPVVKNKKGDFISLIKDIQKSGFIRARIDGSFVTLNNKIKLKKNLTHDIDIVVDRLIIKNDSIKRLSESVKTALNMGKGVFSAIFGEDDLKEVMYSELNSCAECGISLGYLSPGMFSFNSPYGACEMCHGMGNIDLLDPELMVVDEDFSIEEGAIPLITIEDVPMIEPNKRILNILSQKYKINLKIPWRDLTDKEKDIILNGHPDIKLKIPYWEVGRQKFKEESFLGFRKIFFDRFHSTDKVLPRDLIKRYMRPGLCLQCNGERLKKESLFIKIDGYSIIDLTDQPIEILYETLKNLQLNDIQKTIGQDVIDEIIIRLQFLKDVGLGYLTLSRRSNTLGGGEAQRIKLATQIGSGLLGVLYVLDEPTIGLHSRDTDRLLNSLKRLKNLGNSVLIVEHDKKTIMSADHLIELGPNAGVHGGELIFNGKKDDLLNNSDSITAKYLRNDILITIPSKRRVYNSKNVLTISECLENNLKNLTVSFPLNCFVAVSGVSGSGKSTIVNKTLYKALQQKLTRAKVRPGKFKKITGYNKLESVIEISQSPIGRTPRSNPATYTGVFDLIRDFYAKLPDSQIMGLKASHFSFNVKGGRCEACKGDGMCKIEMHFLPDVYVPCEVCKGKRYDREILDIKYKEKSISQVLQSTVSEALTIFKNIKPIYDKLKLLSDVGLSYIKLGQSATTLSGGEAQRVKLAAELGSTSKGKTLYILDEPTTGLHLADIQLLLNVLQRLINKGHSVIVIEHNIEVLATSDYIIDLGPEGGDKGGEIIFSGTPDEIINHEKSYTGKYIKEYMESIGKV